MQYSRYCMVCTYSNINHSLNLMLQKLTHHLSHVSYPCAPLTSLSYFNNFPSPFIFSKFQYFPLSSIPPNLFGTPMAKLPRLQLVATKSHTATTFGSSCWCGLLLSWNVSLCFLVLPSSAMVELLLAATIFELLLPHRLS